MKLFLNFIKVCHNEFFDNIFHKFCSFELWTERNLWGRLHREKKDWEKRKIHHGPYNTERRSFVWERKILISLIMPQWMNESTSFCSFWSCGLRETSVVDYTDIERLREKKGKCFPSPAAHYREKKFFF